MPLAALPCLILILSTDQMSAPCSFCIDLFLFKTVSSGKTFGHSPLVFTCMVQTVFFHCLVAVFQNLFFYLTLLPIDEPETLVIILMLFEKEGK